jgi:hypothetical protein
LIRSPLFFIPFEPGSKEGGPYAPLEVIRGDRGDGELRWSTIAGLELARLQAKLREVSR